MTSTANLVRPRALRPGDTVGIIAPASPIERELLLRGCNALRAMGYVPVYDESIFSGDWYFAGSLERRIAELHRMFLRDDISAIICARGGYGCNYLLPHIDVELIRSHPKIFVGYSDVTTLLTWMHDAAGLTVFHGPMVTKDFALPNGVDMQSWMASVGGSHTWKLPVAPLVEGKAEGKLYGGCLSMLAASLGTPYEIRTDGTILFIEDVATRPYQIDRMLMQLRLAGKFDHVRGLVFGIMQDCAAQPEVGYTLKDVIQRIVGDLAVPVAIGMNSGHVPCGNITLPIGVRASLAVEQDGARLAMLETAVLNQR